MFFLFVEPARVVIVIVGKIVHGRFKEGRPPVAPTRLCDLAVLVEKQRFRAFALRLRRCTTAPFFSSCR